VVNDPVSAGLWQVKTKQFSRKPPHQRAEQLARTGMVVQRGGFGREFVKRFHSISSVGLGDSDQIAH